MAEVRGADLGPVPVCARCHGSPCAALRTSALCLVRNGEILLPGKPTAAPRAGSDCSSPDQPFTLKLGEVPLSSPQPKAGANGGVHSPCVLPMPPRQRVMPPSTHLPSTHLSQSSAGSSHRPAVKRGVRAPCRAPCQGGVYGTGGARQSRGNAPGVLGSACSTTLPPAEPGTLASPRRASPLRHRPSCPAWVQGVGPQRTRLLPGVQTQLCILLGRVSASFGPRGGRWDGGARPGMAAPAPWGAMLCHPWGCSAMGQGPRCCLRGPNVALHAP